MSKRQCLKIAQRISAGLVRELQQGIDPERMLKDTRYARDVLLVCEAHPGTDLAVLARHFRAAWSAAQAQPEPEGPMAGASRFFSSFFGGLGEPAAPAAEASRRTGWFRSRQPHDRA